MKVKKLLKGIPIQQVKGSKEVAISGLCANSKLVAPGHLFIAKKGKTDDGARYIPEAIQAGACAILTDLYDPSLKHVTQLIHSDVAAMEAMLAAAYYQFPSDHLWMVGVTGTSGKTTISLLTKYLLDHLYGPCGLIGTIEYIMGQHRYPATRTTPDVIQNHRLLREMIKQGCRSAVMEVTSHAMDQGRVAEIDFDVAIFSNLTPEHLDYHPSMEHYAEAKSHLFRSLGKGKKKAALAILNVDDPWHMKMRENCNVPILTYGIDHPADLMASHIHLNRTGTALQVTYQGKTVACQWPLVGRFNVYNCLAAMVVALSRQMALEEVAARMVTLPFVRGRLEAVPNDLQLKIYVDFAHKDDALANVLQTLEELKTGRIITVFGCGGDRDRFKRPRMAATSERYSDWTIVTSDNPRSEDPEAICQEIAKGFTKKNYTIELDRRLAIRQAIEMASKEDIILIAGKGHEVYQIFAHKTIEFDDCKVVAEICSELQIGQKC